MTENNTNTNNTIADELIYGQANIAKEQTPQQVQATQQEDEQVSSRVESTKSKMYVLLFLGLGLLLFYQFVLPAYDKNKTSKTILNKVEQEVASFQDKKQIAENNLALLKLMENKQEDILWCINTNNKNKTTKTTKCAEFTGKNLDEIKDFLNLNNLSNNKMVIDEKKILANLNEFLLRKNENGEYNGNIEWVHIGEEEAFDKNIYVSPVDLKIAFDNKDDLLSFVDNIEKRILEQKEYRILYQIENIKYDILKSQEKQSVDIAMNMFYTR